MRPTHAEAERRFLELLEAAGLRAPDEIVHRRDEILFLWDATKTAVVLELDDEPATDARDGGAPPRAEAA